jgi:hypothetical protein
MVKGVRLRAKGKSQRTKKRIISIIKNIGDLLGRHWPE